METVCFRAAFMLHFWGRKRAVGKGALIAPASYIALYGGAGQGGGTVLEKATGYGISTTLSGADCYLGRLEELRRDGMTHVELCLRADFEEQASLYPAALEAIRRAGLRVWSVHLPFGGGVSPACAEETRRIANVELLKRFVDLTRDSGAGIYVIHGSFEPVQEWGRKPLLASAAVSLQELAAYMGQLGMTLALENLPRTCVGRSAEEVAYLTGRVPALRLCFDTNHFTPLRPDVRFRPLQRAFPSLRAKWNPAAENGVSYARTFGGKIVTVHISDYDGIDECHWLPGQGLVDFAGIHAALMGAGFGAPVIFEPNERCKGRKTTGRRLIAGYEKAIGAF